MPRTIYDSYTETHYRDVPIVVWEPRWEIKYKEEEEHRYRTDIKVLYRDDTETLYKDEEEVRYTNEY